MNQDRSSAALSEAAMVAMVAAAAAGAIAGRYVQVSALALVGGAVGLVLLWWLVARPGPQASLVLLAVGLVALGRGVQAEAEYELASAGSYSGWVTLVTDPAPSRFGSSAEVSTVNGDRVVLAAGFEHSWFGTLVAGEAVKVEGTIRPINPTEWARSRHLVGRLSVTHLGEQRGVAWWRYPSEWMRGGVNAGAEQLPYEWQPLYTGLVIGDDRFQSVGQQARFRAAGLSHLLAVSGQNVAFVLAVATPLLERLRWWPRIAARVGLLVAFAIATRLEPSVLRATATAAVSVWAMTSEARASGVRALSVAVVGLLLVDPFLVWSVGFRLSVAASLGILVIGPVLDDRLPGADSKLASLWRTPLTVTLGAQIGVTPLLISTFGPVSLVSVPANLLAGWAAGLVMTWGLTGGLVAAWIGPSLGGVIQLPAQWAMTWIDSVASLALATPAPMVGTAASGAALAVLGALWFVQPQSRWVRYLAIGLVGVLAAGTIPRPPTAPTSLVGGGQYWPGNEASDSVSVLVVSAAADDRLIDAVVERRIRSVDTVVVEAGGRAMSDLVGDLSDVMDPGIVLAPPLHRVVGGRRVLEPVSLRAQAQALEVWPVADDRLEVRAGGN